MSRKSSYRFHNVYDEPIKETKEEDPIEKAFDTVDLDDENEVTVDKETEINATKSDKEDAKKMVNKLDTLAMRTAKVNTLSNMREKPDMGSNILQVLEAGTQITIYPGQGDFYKMEYKGQLGYIKKELCS